VTNTSAAVKVTNTVGLGIAMMLLGDFLFAANDVMGKWLVATYSVGQVLLIRSLAALIVLVPLVWRAGWRTILRLEQPKIQILRVVLATCELVCFYAAVVYLPIADVMTVYLASPIYVAALSPWLLGETVSRRQWIAIAVGFVGVIVVLQPSSESLSMPSIIALVGSFAFALVVLQGRQLRRTPDVTLVFWQTIGALICGLALAPIGWVPPTTLDYGLLGALGIIAMAAHLCINRSLKLAPAAVVAPLQYTLLLWAIIFGWFVFGDVPKTPMLIGGAIIIGAGIFLFERSKKPDPEPVRVEIG
jgi:drug/metabolite transporter (DMT)-like permease